MRKKNIDPIFSGKALSPTLPTSRDKEEWQHLKLTLNTTSWFLKIESILPGFDGQWLIGNSLLSTRLPLETITAQILACYSVTNLASVLRWSPFWLDDRHKLAYPDYPEDSFENRLIRYHLAEICLSLLEQLRSRPNLPFNLQDSHILLLRQRFRYLAALPAEKISDYEYTLRIARETYAHFLLEKTERVELAFARAKSPGSESWSLDDEYRLLLTNDQTNTLWPIAHHTPSDTALTHRLIRQGLLGRNHLAAATDTVANLMTVTPSSSSRFWRGARTIIAQGLRRFHIWICLLTSLAAIIFCWSNQSNTRLFLTTAILTLIPPAMIWLAAALLMRGQPVILYPLALRIPAMALLGVIGITGLSDTYTTFALNAWDAPVIAYLITIFCLFVAVGYLFFQSVTRTKDWRSASYRTLLLSGYTLAAAFWISLAVAWFSDPLGFTACNLQQTNCIVYGPLTGHLQLNRSVILFGQRVSKDFTFFFTALSLLIGVLTQLFWEDKSVTEPI